MFKTSLSSPINCLIIAKRRTHQNGHGTSRTAELSAGFQEFRQIAEGTKRGELRSALFDSADRSDRDRSGGRHSQQSASDRPGIAAEEPNGRVDQKQHRLATERRRTSAPPAEDRGAVQPVTVHDQRESDQQSERAQVLPEHDRAVRAADGELLEKHQRSRTASEQPEQVVHAGGADRDDEEAARDTDRTGIRGLSGARGDQQSEEAEQQKRK